MYSEVFRYASSFKFCSDMYDEVWKKGVLITILSLALYPYMSVVSNGMLVGYICFVKKEE